MTRLRYIVGDLLKSDEVHIAHGCNTMGVMGAGFAQQIRKLYPEVDAEYQVLCDKGDFNLGAHQPTWTTSVVDAEGSVRCIHNLGTQRRPGKDGSYWGVMIAFANLFEWCAAHDVKRVAIPRIGCGLAGLDWATVKFVINGVYDYVPDAPDVIVWTRPEEVEKFG